MSVDVRLATANDAHLPAYDYSGLSAVNQCPTWGIIRYGHSKTNSAAGRAMALELGTAAHEVFAAVRLFQLRHYQSLVSTSDVVGVRLFGQSRYEQILVEHNKHLPDLRTAIVNGCLEVIHTGDFHDDPSDKRRTVTNLEEACIAYIDRWDFERYPVWVRDIADPASAVGIEVGFDLVVVLHLDDAPDMTFRYIGRIDGIHLDPKSHNAVTPHENKTAARLNEAWSMSFLMSHQVTGYTIAASLLTQAPCSQAVVIGLSIPLPRSYDLGGIATEYVTRSPSHIVQFFQWLFHSVSIAQRYHADPASAPKYTHSCNRYFRPCSLIPYCASDDDEKARIFAEMEVNVWSPLDETLPE